MNLVKKTERNSDRGNSCEMKRIKIIKQTRERTNCENGKQKPRNLKHQIIIVKTKENF